MQLTNLFVSLLLTTAVAAKGKNGTSTKAVTDKSQCKEIQALTKIINLAANETKLADKTDNNATLIAEFQAKASTAATTLATMESNTTLVSTCNVIAAAERTEDDCEDMTSMEKLIALAANETALAAKTKNNATKAEAIQAKASAASTKLATLQANTTLTDTCSTMAADKAANKAAKQAAQSSSSSSAAAASSTSTKSAADMLNARSGLVATIVMVAAGMMMM